MANIIQICGQAFQWRLKREPRLKKIHIQFHPQEGIIVRAPVGLTTSAIADVLCAQGKRLLVNIEEISRRCPRREYCAGDNVPYLGESKQIRLKGNGGRRPYAQWGDEFIDIYMADSTKEGRETVRECLISLYRQRAEEWFPERVAQLNKLYFSQNIRRVTVKNLSRTLGSCSNRGNLNFNWRLLLAPADVVDYVIVHELAHMLEMNHSRQFWQVVEKACPEYKLHRAWLRDMAGALYL